MRRASAYWPLELPVEEDLIRALLFYTGLRVTPVCMIRMGDISFDPAQLRAVVKARGLRSSDSTSTCETSSTPTS
jgi:integrase